MRGANWIVGRSFGVSSPETAFYLENHGGHFALRNQASGQYVSAEDNCLRANRREYKDWEKFSIEILRTDQSLTLLTPYGPILANEAVPCFDLVMTYHVAFRARIRTNRYGGTIGLHKKSISPCNHDTTWEFIPAHHRQAYLIRNADHPDVYWTATAKDNAVKAGAPREGESEFEVNFKAASFFTLVFLSCFLIFAPPKRGRTIFFAAWPLGALRRPTGRALCATAKTRPAGKHLQSTCSTSSKCD